MPDMAKEVGHRPHKPTKKAPSNRFTEKQDRQAEHVAESERKRGMPAKKAKSVGYATVNKNAAKKNDAGKDHGPFGGDNRPGRDFRGIKKSKKGGKR